MSRPDTYLIPAQRPERRRPRPKSSDDKPLRIAAAPTMRLNEDAIIENFTSPALPPPRAVPTLPKPPSPPRTAQVRFQERLLSVPAMLLTAQRLISHPLAANPRMSFLRRIRFRALMLLLCALVSAATMFISIYGIVACMVTVAASVMELRMGWSSLSNRATWFTRIAVGVSAASPLVRALWWLIEKG